VRRKPLPPPKLLPLKLLLLLKPLLRKPPPPLKLLLPKPLLLLKPLLLKPPPRKPPPRKPPLRKLRPRTYRQKTLLTKNKKTGDHVPKQDGAQNDRVCVGAIAGVHGVKGLVRIKAFTENDGDVAAYGPLSDRSGGQVFELEVIGRAKGMLLGKLKGVNDRDAAARLKGTELYVDRAALPPPAEDEFYHTDLINLTVVHVDGRHLGNLVAVHNHGAGDLIEVALGGDHDSALLPFNKQAVPTVDLAAGQVTVDPPRGLLPGDPEAP
jgi:16S rRNA processing protein RimM